MGDLDLSCFDCTWAHHEMPGCQRIMALIKARPQHLSEPSEGDCCLTKCSCLPNCDGCSTPPPAAERCVCLEPKAAHGALHALRKYCSSFRPADLAHWVADASRLPFGGHYDIPEGFRKFCSLQTEFSVEGGGTTPCQGFLQRLVLSPPLPGPAQLPLHPVPAAPATFP